MPFGKKTGNAPKQLKMVASEWTLNCVKKGKPPHILTVRPGPILTKPALHACAHFMPDRLPAMPDTGQMKRLGLMMIAAKQFLAEMERHGLGDLDVAMMPQCCLEYIEDDPGIRGIIHIGAHIGQEAKWYYSKVGERCVHIECNPRLMPRLEKNVSPFGHTAIQACIWNVAGEVSLFLCIYMCTHTHTYLAIQSFRRAFGM